MKTFLGALILCAVMTPPAWAGALADALANLDDGRLYFEYETRAGVYGNGVSISFGDGWSGNCDCDEGPARVWIRVRDGRVNDVDVRIGGREKSRRSDTVDLGVVNPLEAADLLLAIVESGDDGDLDEAILGAVVAEGFDDHGRLVDIARNGRLDGDVREDAIFWLGQAAGEKSAGDLVALVDDDDEELELREHAIFALSQLDIDACIEPLRRVATTSRHPQLREKAFFWLAQHDDPRVIDLFEDVLLSK